MKQPTCPECESTRVCLASATALWKSTGEDTGYWYIDSYDAELECLDCDAEWVPGD